MKDKRPLCSDSPPKVSIGLPVYNGENFTQEAVESLLAQTHADFELIISDNASTDRTEAICRELMRRDSRIQYFRNEVNLGASRNYIRVFELARGQFFKWAAHDDICLPDFLARCVEVLDQNPECVLCFTQAAVIDAQGQRLATWEEQVDLDSGSPRRRFRATQLLAETIPIWGLMRSDILRKTPLLGNYPGHDRPLLGELALHGPFYQVPKVLFLSRDHAQRSIRVYDYRKPHEALVWYDPRRADKLVFPEWRLLAEYMAAIRRSDLKIADRVGCYLEMAKWAHRHRQELLRDLFMASAAIPAIGKRVHAAYNWLRPLGRAIRDLERILPHGAQLILVDDFTLNADEFEQWQLRHFIEHDGRYWGRPHDDDHALRELERMRREGAAFMAFTWPAFWWLDYYKELARHLQKSYPCVLRNKRLIVFDLRNRLVPTTGSIL